MSGTVLRFPNGEITEAHILTSAAHGTRPTAEKRRLHRGQGEQNPREWGGMQWQREGCFGIRCTSAEHDSFGRCWTGNGAAESSGLALRIDGDEHYDRIG